MNFGESEQKPSGEDLRGTDKIWIWSMRKRGFLLHIRVVCGIMKCRIVSLFGFSVRGDMEKYV